MILDQAFKPKSPPVGYASSKYQPIRWPQEALIEGWCSPQSEAQHGIDDDRETRREVTTSGARRTIEPLDVANRQKTDAVRSIARRIVVCTFDLPFHRRNL